jgi:hypothetical protein
MKTFRNIEKRMRHASLKSNSEVNQAVLNDLLNHWDQSPVGTVRKPGLGRIIMERRSSRIAAAIVVFALIISGILSIGGKNQGVALGDVVASMQKMPWVHVKATVHQADQTLFHEEWECFDPRISIKIEPDGVIRLRDYDQGIVSVYQPKDNTIMISPVTDRFNKRGPGSPSGAMQDMIAKFESQGSQVVRTKTTQGQFSVEVIQLKDEHQEITLVLDVDRQVPLTIETVAQIPETGQKFTASAVFAYPDQGPTDIYSLDVPADAQVIDKNIGLSSGIDANPEVESLLLELQQRRSRGYGDHTAVMMASHVVEQGLLSPWNVLLIRRLDTIDRVDTFYVGTNKKLGDLRLSVIDDWPHLKITEVLALERKGPIYESIVEGENVSVLTSKDFGTKRFQAGNHQHCRNSMVNLAWPIPDVLEGQYQSDRKVELQIINNTATPPEWIGLLVTSSGVSDSGKKKEKIEEYWFDASRDYLLMEHTTKGDFDDQFDTFYLKWSTLEVAQTQNGNWYPSKKRSMLKYTYYQNKNIKTVEQEKEYSIRYDDKVIPDEDVFSAILQD